MIFRCKNCTSALVYDIKLTKMVCKYCDSMFSLEEVAVSDSEKNMLESNIFACTSCGAELAINHVEASSYCAYCGQPTVIFERITRMQRPEKILPFKITKEEAEQKIKHRLKKGFFVPKTLKNFEIERITGIYIPYWIYDIKYRDSQTIHVKKWKYSRDYKVKGRVTFTGLTVDASSNLSNTSSQQLEPYDLSGLQEFDERYLSGFYADCYDQSAKDLSEVAFGRCKEMYDSESINHVATALSGSVKTSNPVHKIVGKSYTMLPAWFMTTRYNNQAYTMMVNGQTGKVIGAVPYEKKKVVGIFAALLAIFLLFIPAICIHFLRESEHFLVYWGLITFWLFVIGWSFGISLKQGIKETSAKELQCFHEDRQEDEYT